METVEIKKTYKESCHASVIFFEIHRELNYIKPDEKLFQVHGNLFEVTAIFILDDLTHLDLLSNQI